MYPNLKAEMARKGLTGEALAKELGIAPATLSAKLNIQDRIKLYECELIRKKFFPSLTIDYLFVNTKEDHEHKAS